MYVRKPVTLIPMIVTWQSADGEPVAKVQVTVMLSLSSSTAVEDWRPVVPAG